MERMVWQPISLFEKDFTSVRALPNNSEYGTKKLVRRDNDGQYFSAKKQVLADEYETARLEQRQLKHLQHPNIVGQLNTYHTPGRD